jgi:Icc-related predicted phosphoesterase
MCRTLNSVGVKFREFSKVKDKEIVEALNFFYEKKSNSKKVLLIHERPPCGLRLHDVSNIIVHEGVSWELTLDDIVSVNTQPVDLKIHQLVETI